MRFRIRVGPPRISTRADLPRDRKDVRKWKVETMVRSKEEWQRIQEEEDAAPYLPGFTVGEFERLTESQQQHESQKFLQFSTSSLGYWKTCKLSSCRRAKACKGFLSEAQVKSGRYLTSFPPCIREGAYRQEATLAEAARLFGGEDAEG
jgi:hypothetical protein